MFKTKSALYKHIWDTREHKSEVSGDNLLPPKHPQFHWQMCHILPHGSYPSFKFEPDNIILMTVEEHARQESIPEFKRRFELMKRRYYKEVYGKVFDDGEPEE